MTASRTTPSRAPRATSRAASGTPATAGRAHRGSRPAKPATVDPAVTADVEAVEPDETELLDAASDETSTEANAPAPERASADLDEVAASADLVRVYLNEIGKVALL